MNEFYLSLLPQTAIPLDVTLNSFMNYLGRHGEPITARDVFFAWNSGGLSQMLDDLPLESFPVERHFLLQNVVAAVYKDRENEMSRHICRVVGELHIDEFPTIAPALIRQMRVLPRVTTFAYIATLLTEDGEFDEAIAVCRRAQALGLHDGTKGDFAGRIERIQDEAEHS